MTDELIGIRIEFDAKTGELKIAARDIAKLRGAVDRVGDEMRKADAATKGWFVRLKRAHPVGAHLAKYASWAAGITAVTSAMKAGVRHVVEMGRAAERWASKLTAARGSAALAAKDMRFLREQAERLGLRFSESVDAFASFAAAAKGTALEGEGGSSPRVRGTQLRLETLDLRIRFIPACAGNSTTPRHGRRSSTVHPRVCGELNEIVAAAAENYGSSPRVRGTLASIGKSGLPTRFIPACAGNSLQTTWDTSG